MIRHVLIDLDDTIFDFLKCEAAAIRRTFTQMDIPVSDAIVRRYSDINAMCWARYDRGEITRERVLLARFEQLFAELGVTRDVQQVENCYRRELGVGYYFVPGAKEALAYLGGKYPLYLASNGVAQTQFSRMEQAGIDRCFRGVFISETAHAHKPEPAYFDYCLAHMDGADPAACIIIGDNLHSDISGGAAAGMKTCWFNFRRQPADPAIRADYEITDWAQIRAIL